MLDLNLDLRESDLPMVENDRFATCVVAAPVVAPPAASSLRCSPCIQQAYDGVQVSPVERAAKRKVMESGSSSRSGPSRRPGSSYRRKKARAKAAAVAGLLELPLLATPTPLTRSKLKLIAQGCDLNASAILDHARTRADSAVLGEAPTSPSVSASSASSMRILDTPISCLQWSPLETTVLLSSMPVNVSSYLDHGL